MACARRAVVVGSGQMGIAMSLALSRAEWSTTLFVKDKTAADVIIAEGHLSVFSPKHRIPIPANLSIVPLSEQMVVDESASRASLLCVCVPSASVHDVAPLVNVTTGAGGAVLNFARGLSANGLTPRQQLLLTDKKLLNTSSDVRSRMITATGPIFAKDWAAEHEILRGRISSEAPPRVASPLTLGISRNSPPSLIFSDRDAILLPRCVTLPMMSSPLSLDDHVEIVEECAEYTNALSLITSVGAGLVSNQFPGNISAMSSYCLHCLTATSSLVEKLLIKNHFKVKHESGHVPPTQQAQESTCTEQADAAKKFLIRNLCKDPLLASTTMSSCYNMASREFAFGRMLDYNFRRHDAVKDHFHKGSLHQLSLDQTIDGIFALLQGEEGDESAFFTTLCDAALCIVRGSSAGQFLTRTGEYEWIDNVKQPPRFVEDMKRLDEAVASDNLLQYEAAKNRLAEVLSSGSR